VIGLGLAKIASVTDPARGRVGVTKIASVTDPARGRVGVSGNSKCNRYGLW